MKLSATQLDVLGAVERGEVYRLRSYRGCYREGKGRQVTATVGVLARRRLVELDSALPGSVREYWRVTSAGREALGVGGGR